MRRERRRPDARDRMPRRATDRVEDAVACLLISAALVLLVVAGTTGIAVHAQGLERSRVEAVDRTGAVAFLVEDAPAGIASRDDTLPLVGVPARWSGPDGESRTGSVAVHVGSRAGAEVRIWVDRDGQVVPAPTTPLNALAAGLLSAFELLIAGGAVLGAAWAAVCLAVAERNARRWEHEWARVGAKWSRS